MTAEIGAGNAAVGIGGTVPAGQVGLWCSHGSANEFDDFVVRDQAGPYLAAVGWYSNVGAVQVDASNGNTIKTGSPDYRERTVWYDGFRGGKFVMTYRFKWNTGEGVQPGALVRYVDNGNWLAVYVATADGKARLRKREADGPPDTVTTSATVLSLTTTNWYTARVVIGDDLGNSALQRLRFWVDTDDDGDWSDETALLNTTAIDDVWSAGKVGVYSAPGGNVAEFDDFKVGYDNNADLDIDDGGDDVQVDENFNSNAATLAYDDNGNLTDDGVYKFVYDAWNRMVQVKRRPDAATAIATYAYDAVNRRQSKVVTNCGIENTAGDGGDTTVHFYYGSATGGIGSTGILAGSSLPWNIFETRNGSNQTTRQWAWGTQYIDEVLFMDVNGDPSADDDSDIDVTAGGESGESPADKRYFYHQDRNWNVVALTEYSPPGSPSNVSGRIAERYAYTPYGEFVVLTGDGGNGEMAAARAVSVTGCDRTASDNFCRLNVAARRVMPSVLYDEFSPDRGPFDSTPVDACLLELEQSGHTYYGMPFHHYRLNLYSASYTRSVEGMFGTTTVRCCNNVLQSYNNDYEVFHRRGVPLPPQGTVISGRLVRREICDCIWAAAQRWNNDCVCYSAIGGPNSTSFVGCLFRACTGRDTFFGGFSPYGWNDLWDWGHGNSCRNSRDLQVDCAQTRCCGE